MSYGVKRFSSFFVAVIAATLTFVNSGSASAQDDGNGEAAVEALELFVMPQSGPFRPDQISIPQQKMIEAWARSAHADASAEAFTHWDGEGEVPASCSTCHSGAGFRAFHGLDGSEPGVAAAVPVGGVVDC